MNLATRLAASAGVIGVLAGAQGAHAQEAATAAAIDSVIVTGKRNAGTTLADIPGGTSVISAEQLQVTRIANLGDALKFVPGLFAQSISGGEATLLSLRGSGISKGGFTYGNGVQVLFDGLPLTSLFGTPYEAFEPNALARIEVFKGANAFEYGANQLGGAINMIQHTGHDADKLFLRLEGGSDGYQREQISSGQVIGPFDYYVSLTHFQTDGYRDNSSASSTRLVGNLGYQLAPSLKTRFYYSFAVQEQGNVNSVTLTQLLNTPKANPFTGDRLNRGSLFLADKTTWTIDDRSSLEVGLGYKKPPLHNGNLPQRTYWHLSDWSTTVKYRRKDSLFGRESNTTIGLLQNSAIDSGATVTNQITKAVLGDVKYGGSNYTILAANDLELVPKLWATTGIAWIQQTRKNEILNPVAKGVDPKFKRTYVDYTPRFGLRYEATPDIQVYGNVSRLIEAPQTISYTTTLNGAYTGFGANPKLVVQTGTSYEAGFKGDVGRLRWDVDFYHTRFNNELLTVYTTLPSPAVPNGVTATTNAAPTIHEGIEAAVEAVLIKDGRNTVSLRQSYTWNNFHFVDQNLAAGRGVLPRIPKHFYQAELTYRHASGLYASVNLEAVLSRYPVDYVNQTFAPTYAVVGATLGYAPPAAKWRVFLQGQNLADRRYASSASATFNGTGAAVFTPAQGRTVTAGLSYAF